MIQVKNNGQVVVEELEEMRSEFARHHCALLPQLLEPPLLGHLLRQVSKARMEPRFEYNGEEKFGSVLYAPQTEPVVFVFHLLLNNRALFQAIEKVTDCPPIGNFFGRLHQSASGAGHHIEWHGDNADHRMLGLTINLSAEEYDGGLFQLRKKNTRHIVCEVPRKQAGDAFIFRISPGLQHRLTATNGSGRRTVGVGWFRSHPDFRTFADRYFRFSASARNES